MHKKIKRVQFSQVFEIMDPVTKEIDKKDAKSFMVNQSTLFLERDQLIMSRYDDMLWTQMMNYQVIRKTERGRPIYTSENEHALDALMLTLLGFTLEFPEITKILEEIHFSAKSYLLDNEAAKEKAYTNMYDPHKKLFKEIEEQKQRIKLGDGDRKQFVHSKARSWEKDVRRGGTYGRSGKMAVRNKSNYSRTIF